MARRKVDPVEQGLEDMYEDHKMRLEEEWDELDGLLEDTLMSYYQDKENE